MNIRRTTAIAALLIGGLTACQPTHPITNAPLLPQKQQETIYEDDPRWDCRTMGNRVCGDGTVLPDGTVIDAGDYHECVSFPGGHPFSYNDPTDGVCS